MGPLPVHHFVLAFGASSPASRASLSALRRLWFVVCMECWLGLAVRYRLPRRKRVESPSLEFVRNLLLGRPLRLDHLLFPFSPSATKRRMA
jgi:hypothetical protein